MTVKVLYTETELLEAFGTPPTKDELDAAYFSALQLLSTQNGDPDADDESR